MRTTTGHGQMAQDSNTVAGRQDNPMMPTRDTLLSISRQLVDGMMNICILRRDFCVNTQVMSRKLPNIIP